jgi:hypothetical protein
VIVVFIIVAVINASSWASWAEAWLLVDIDVEGDWSKELTVPSEFKGDSSLSRSDTFKGKGEFWNVTVDIVNDFVVVDYGNNIFIKTTVFSELPNLATAGNGGTTDMYQISSFNENTFSFLSSGSAFIVQVD